MSDHPEAPGETAAATPAGDHVDPPPARSEVPAGDRATPASARIDVAPGLSYETAPTRKGGRETAVDMVRTLLVILVPVLLLVLVVARQPSPDPVRVVDWKPQAALAAAQAPFPVVAPAGLEPSWRATSVRYEPVPTQRDATVWHLGFLTPEGTYAGVDQSDARADDFVKDATSKGAPAGEASIGGATWHRYQVGADGVRALARPWGTSTVVVSGSAAWPTLEHLAGTLRELPKGGGAVAASGAAAAPPPSAAGP